MEQHEAGCFYGSFAAAYPDCWHIPFDAECREDHSDGAPAIRLLPPGEAKDYSDQVLSDAIVLHHLHAVAGGDDGSLHQLLDESLRRRRYFCVTCGHPVAGLGYCPECGGHEWESNRLRA